MTLEWHEDDRGCLTGIAWKDWLDRSDKFIDPYLVWADIAGSASYAAPDKDGGDAPQKWPFIVELASDFLTAEHLRPNTNERCNDVPWIFGVIDIPGIYKLERSRTPEASPDCFYIDGRYVTARLYAHDVIHLLCSEHVRRAQLGLPRIPIMPTPAQAFPEVPGGGVKKRIVIGIIDDGFGFAHPRLLDVNGAPRVRYLWDQDVQRETSHAGGIWKMPDLVGYGAELGPEEMERLLLSSAGDPLGPYGDARYGRYRLDPLAHSSAPQDADKRCLPLATLIASTHGHAVMDLAAGYPPRHRGQTRPLEQSQLGDPRPPQDAGQFVKEAVRDAADSSTVTISTDELIARLHNDSVSPMDSADQWPMVCVQLPVRTVADTSGGSLAVHVLDGLRYILDRAYRIPYFDATDAKEGELKFDSNKVVVNVSYGAFGGGHDGSSVLERAIDNLVKRKPGLWVVLAAGNAHGASTHTSLEMVPGDRRNFAWEVPADNPLESYLEIWLPDRDVLGSALPHGLAQQIRVSVQPPGGPALPQAYSGACWQLRPTTDGSKGNDGNPRGNTLAAIVRPERVVQSEHGTMILVAVAPTRGVDPSRCTRPAAPYGEWTVGLHWDAPDTSAPGPQLQIHVWTERNDLVFGVPRRQQSRVFSDEPVSAPNEADPEERAAWSTIRSSPAQLRTGHATRPQVTLSSLASGPPARANFSRLDDATSRGAVVVVGSHRLSNGEVGALSSGGPSRLTSHREEWDHLTARATAPEAKTRRAAPDVSAPGDLSTSVPGLRTAGFHSAIETRISATSAAAALVTRAIANVQYISQLADNDNEFKKLLDDAERLFFEDRLAWNEESPARPTLTPRGDDTFRRGRFGLR